MFEQVIRDRHGHVWRCWRNKAVPPDGQPVTRLMGKLLGRDFKHYAPPKDFGVRKEQA